MTAQQDRDQQEQPEKVAHEGEAKFDPGEKEVFSRGLQALNDAKILYVVGGAFAKHAYTGIWRDTKDLDIFLKPEDLKPALDALRDAGFETEVTYNHWLAKARQDPHFIDLIFGAGHGLFTIDDTWLEHYTLGTLADVETRLVAVEELIALKAFVASRDRFDGADVLHLIRGTEGRLDWNRLVDRFADHRSLLLWHLLLFNFVYPDKAEYLPQGLVMELFGEVRDQWLTPQDAAKFRGTLLDSSSFTVDIEQWGYEDMRNLTPRVDETGRYV